MRLCLFIGHHKVGSTALQDFLSINAGRLAMAGILYPPVESEGMATLMRQLRDPAAPAPPSFNAREAHNALVFRMRHEALGTPVPAWHPGLPSVHQMLLAVRNMVRLLEPRAVILCAESFSTLAARPEMIERLARQFPGAEVSLHCTLRRPDDHLVSWHAQRLRFGERIAPLSAEGLGDYLGTSIHLDYARWLVPWRAVFPEARLSLRRYESVLCAGGSVEDFQRESALEFPAGLEPPRRLNRSLHPALVEIGRRANLRDEPQTALRLVEALIEASAGLSPPAAREVELFGTANRARLHAAFAPVAGRLADLAGVEIFADHAEILVPRKVPLADAQATLLPRVLERLPKDLARQARALATEEIAA